jgi:hypothetical protein
MLFQDPISKFAELNYTEDRVRVKSERICNCNETCIFMPLKIHEEAKKAGREHVGTEDRHWLELITYAIVVLEVGWE